jgi:DNA-binding MarR family transcriptional regulator
MGVIGQVRSFNRAVTRSMGILAADYLGRRRPLAESRLLFEIGENGASANALRARLQLDSGYLSRLLSSLERQGLVSLSPDPDDRRIRLAELTPDGRAELRALDKLSNERADSIVAPLDERQRTRLAQAMAEVERLLVAAAVRISDEPPASADARRCLDLYYQELQSRFHGGFDPDYVQAPALGEFAAPRGAFLVMRLDGEPIGCGGLRELAPDRAYIKRMWVSQSCRGMGLGRRLLGALEDKARALGYGAVCLETHDSLAEAQQLYRSAGYEQVPPFNDEPYAQFWFEKALSFADCPERSP